MTHRAPLLHASIVLLVGMTLGACNDKKIAALDTRIATLEKDNKELKHRLADLEQLVRGGRGVAAGKSKAAGGLKGLGGIVQILQGLTSAMAQGSGNRGITRRVPPRPPSQMAPDLQRRIDKLVVESLEKLAKSPDARAFIKTMLRTMRHDLTKKPGPRPQKKPTHP
ncbi:MAG: hypothetical protein KAI47_23065 [Deltaproteobacteria bacterium]|nr:hypothetical protein [Deltaproteobacteria bacterium]